MSELSTLLPFIVAHCHWISSSLMLVQLGHNNQPSSHDRQRHTPPASSGPTFSHPFVVYSGPYHPGQAKEVSWSDSLPLFCDIKDDKSGEGDRHPALVIMKDMMIDMKMRRDTTTSHLKVNLSVTSRRRWRRRSFIIAKLFWSNICGGKWRRSRRKTKNWHWNWVSFPQEMRKGTSAPACWWCHLNGWLETVEGDPKKSLLIPC